MTFRRQSRVAGGSCSPRILAWLITASATSDRLERLSSGLAAGSSQFRAIPSGLPSAGVIIRLRELRKASGNGPERRRQQQQQQGMADSTCAGRSRGGNEGGMKGATVAVG